MAWTSGDLADETHPIDGTNVDFVLSEIVVEESLFVKRNGVTLKEVPESPTGNQYMKDGHTGGGLLQIKVGNPPLPSDDFYYRAWK